MSNTTTSRAYHHGNLLQTLVIQAIQLIEDEGLAALSLRRVAREAGVSQAAPYSHFKNKQALLTAVANEGFERFEKSMQLYSDKSDNYMVGLGVGYVMFAINNPGLFHLMFGGELSEMIDKDGVSEAFNSSYAMLVNGLNDNPLSKFHDEDRQLDTALMWGLVHGIANLLLAQKLEAEDYGFSQNEAFVEALLRRCIV